MPPCALPAARASPGRERRTWGGVICPPRRAIEFIASGAGVNAANADVRFVLLSPALFGGGLLPEEGDTLTLVENGRTLEFTVVRAWLRQIAGVAHTLQLCVCRDAQSDAATAGASGPRKEYWPPDSTH